MKSVTRERFESLVEEAVKAVPGRFRRHLKNLAIVVEDAPDAALLRDMDIEPPDTLFGLYQGTPLTSRGWDFGNALPDRITIFQQPIEAGSENDDDIIASVAETLIHEVGHYFGMSEDQIEAIEKQYWRRRRRTAR